MRAKPVITLGSDEAIEVALRATFEAGWEAQRQGEVESIDCENAFREFILKLTEEGEP